MYIYIYTGNKYIAVETKEIHFTRYSVYHTNVFFLHQTYIYSIKKEKKIYINYITLQNVSSYFIVIYFQIFWMKRMYWFYYEKCV